jgi:hypothetical protein
MVRSGELLGSEEVINALRDRMDSFLGRGKYAASAPVLDGPLQPNRGLDEAETFLSAAALDNLVAVGDMLYFSSGASLLKSDAGVSQEEIATFDNEITCLAAAGSGAFAVGVNGGGIVIRGGRYDGRAIKSLGSSTFICPTDELFLDEKTVIAVSGSAECSAAEWKRDLMSLGETGSVWKIDLESGDQQLMASGLAYPSGVTKLEGHDLLISEAWRHRLIRVAQDPAASIKAVLDDLPGYPGRITPSAYGGYWLAIFAPRNQLVEFVLRERRYCNEMIEKIDPDYWVAPALSSGVSFKEVLQYGALKQMGILKAWAPTWSYGLVALLGSDFHPVASWHSRTDGNKHGVTSVANYREKLIVGAKGAGQAVVLDTNKAFGEYV